MEKNKGEGGKDEESASENKKDNEKASEEAYEVPGGVKVLRRNAGTGLSPRVFLAWPELL